jgi:hypothetical protein
MEHFDHDVAILAYYRPPIQDIVETLNARLAITSCKGV